MNINNCILVQLHHWPRICKRWGKVRINPVLIQGQIKDDGKATIKLALNFWMFIKSVGVLEWTANSFIRFTQTLISQIFICEDIQPAFSSFWTSEISRGFHKNNVLLTSPLLRTSPMFECKHTQNSQKFTKIHWKKQGRSH